MKTKFRCLIVGFFGMIGLVMPGMGKGQIIVSRIQGVGPLLVHFEATYNPDQFHHSLFKWDFGDEVAPFWGTDLKSQNFAEGAVTAHLFEQPGIYEVTLTQKNENGSVFMDTINITVLDPDAIFESPLTICVNPASDNDFTGAPSGSVHISTDSLWLIWRY